MFSATTPLAADLTTHLGKGPDRISARVSAMSEAVERYCAEPGRLRDVVQGSFAALANSGLNVADPREFELPHDSSFAETRQFGWLEGWDLLSDRAAWLPVDLVVSPPTEGLLTDIDTNGLAAGNTVLEAVVHGLCEVIERDSFGQYLFTASFGDGSQHLALEEQISLDDLPDPTGHLLVAILEAGQEVKISRIVSDTGIPVFRCLIIDPAFPQDGHFRRCRFPGLGASPSAEIAVRRSVTEAAQSRVAVIQGARDSYNSLAPRARPLRPAVAGVPRPPVPFTTIPSFESTDLWDDLDCLLNALRRAGFKSAIAFNLSSTDLSIKVTRVRIPGMTSFLVNRRRCGWRCLGHLL